MAWGYGFRLHRLLVPRSTPLGFALAKESVRVLHRFTDLLMPRSTPLGFALAKESMRVLHRFTDLLMH